MEEWLAVPRIPIRRSNVSEHCDPNADEHDCKRKDRYDRVMNWPIIVCRRWQSRWRVHRPDRRAYCGGQIDHQQRWTEGATIDPIQSRDEDRPERTENDCVKKQQRYKGAGSRGFDFTRWR